MTTSIQYYVSAFQNLFNGEPWYGRSLSAILQDVRPEIANKKNTPGQHSIHEVLQHMFAWRELLVKRLKGDEKSKIKLNSAEDWSALPAAYTTEDWKQLKKKISNNQEALIKALEQTPETALSKEFAKSKATLEDHLIGIIQHDIYHIGQIATLSKN